MYFLFRGKVYEKAEVAALFSFLAGLVFLGGNLIWIVINPSLSEFFQNFSKITFNSNLVALIVSGLYYFKPDCRIFINNFFLTFAAVLLWFAGLGFWCLLFPIFYIDLGNYIVPSNIQEWYYFSMFFVFWDHLVTQILFLIMFLYCCRKSNANYLIPVPTKSIGCAVYLCLIIWVFWNVILTHLDVAFPTYGILTNFNPHSEHMELMNLFSLKSLLGCHLLCIIIAYVLLVTFSRISFQIHIHNVGMA
ncbi:hypothetical protein MHF_0087 [Mycoplasma haemofelis Ohio2]|uniref:Uncharacterized protein n=1 Tax=Mycoplasma haemofelis (strain Ohio2) TaxID=859194 RepID=F6FFK3_MYCHI|nr:hypothetical protein MHF_0087 [Mycoplasma haemofelis Ohio2]